MAISTQIKGQNIKPASIFGDHMVLQQGINAPVWGTSKTNQELIISLAGNNISVKADQQGKWMAKLKPMKSGGPFRMIISSSGDSVIYNDVMVGEVWLASGQSNMQMILAAAKDADKEIQEASYPQIRFFTVGLNISRTPLDHVKGTWKLTNPENAKDFSAAAYFFSRELHLERKTPVGIISSSWGSTSSEAWTSGKSLATFPGLKDSVARYESLQEDWEELYRAFEAKERNPKTKPVFPKQKNYPTALYNAMIAPLVPYGIKGVIWYQGENNSSRAIQYRSLFPLLIADWRNQWDNQKLPFLFVQLANFRAANPQPVFADKWALLREAQSMALELPHTGMAVSIDIGDAKNIHPKNKQDVGKRLYLAASHIAYGTSLVYSGPMYKSMKVMDNKIELSFNHIGAGLMQKGTPLTAFEIAGADKKFHWAEATIDGNKIIVSSKNVSKPVAVRYAWSDNPAASLYNKEGLPASPFRTDDW